MKVAIIDYQSGNLRSVQKSLARVAQETGISADIKVTANPDDVFAADRIILPGVGAFGDCAAAIKAIDGLHEAIEISVRKHARPFLGICVGMQLLAQYGYEHGRHAGFGWLDSEVVLIRPKCKELKIPHIGWNELCFTATHPFFTGIQSGQHVYFVHSYHMCGAEEKILAWCDYGEKITAIIGFENIIATQFHPEKSQTVGLRLLANFLHWRP